jgi:hypothetical protein
MSNVRGCKESFLPRGPYGAAFFPLLCSGVALSKPAVAATTGSAPPEVQTIHTSVQPGGLRDIGIRCTDRVFRLVAG